MDVNFGTLFLFTLYRNAEFRAKVQLYAFIHIKKPVLIYNEAMKTKYKDRVSGKKYKRGDYIPIYQINIAQAINKSVDVLRHSYALFPTAYPEKSFFQFISRHDLFFQILYLIIPEKTAYIIFIKETF